MSEPKNTEADLDLAKHHWDLRQTFFTNKREAALREAVCFHLGQSSTPESVIETASKFFSFLLPPEADQRWPLY